LDQEKKEKAKKSLQDDIARLSARVEDAEIVDRDAMNKLEAAGGVNKADEEYTIWLRINTVLLHEVESLRARERKLVEL
jgi:phosphotransferase system IIB component